MSSIKPPIVYVDSFLEVSVPDRIVVVNQDPVDGQEGVGILDVIRFEVIDLGTGLTIPSSVTVWFNGVLAYNGVFQPGFVGSTITKLSTPGSAVLDRWIFLMTHPTWTSEEVITIQVDAVSTGGWSCSETWSFTAADIEKPEVNSVEPISPRVLQIIFNEPVNPSTVIPSAFSLASNDPPYYIPESWTVDQVDTDGRIYQITFAQELSNGRDYLLGVEGIWDDGLPTPNEIDPVIIPFTSAVYPWPDGRLWNLWSWVPARTRWADRLTGSSPGHTEYFIQCLQEIADLLLFDIDEDQYIFDIDRAPEGAIDLLLRFLYNPFKFILTNSQKRKLLRVLPSIHQSKNAPGLIDVIFFFLGILVTIEPLIGSSKSWRLATAGLPLALYPRYGKLGVSTYLRPAAGGSAPYTFIVRVPVALTDDERRKMIQIIEYMKAAHEHYRIIEPPTPPPDYWLLGKTGRGELGKTTLLGP